MKNRNVKNNRHPEQSEGSFKNCCHPVAMPKDLWTHHDALRDSSRSLGMTKEECHPEFGSASNDTRFRNKLFAMLIPALTLGTALRCRLRLGMTQERCHPERSEGSCYATVMSSEILRDKSLRMTWVCEAGRSMVEMLGVLAVIGVLAVMGIRGFQSAMTRHRANELLNESNKRATVVAAQITLQSQTPSLREFSENTFSGGTFDTNVVTEGLNNRFGLKVSNVEEDVCEALLGLSGEGSVLRRLSAESDLLHATNCQNAGKTYVMIYNNDMGGEASDGAEIACPEIPTNCPLNAVIAGTELQCPCTCPEHRKVVDGRCGVCLGEVEKYVPWTQPVLTANGTMGGDAFACARSSQHLGCAPYLVFDNITGGVYDGWHSGAGSTTLPQWISWYNPYPLKINSFSIKNRNDSATYIKDFELQYSDDNTNWSTLREFENESGRSHVTNFPVNNASAHKYWRLYITSSSSNTAYVFIDTLSLSAEELRTLPYDLNPTTLQCE